MVKRQDLTGKVIRRWKVINLESDSRFSQDVKYKCECIECGYEKILRTQTLKYSKSDRCYNCNKTSRNSKKPKHNLRNRKFGKLMAIEPFRRKNRGYWYWKCICDCGNLVETTGDRLLKGRCDNCGCKKAEKLRKNHFLGFGEIGKNYWSHIQRGAKDRNIIFDINIEYCWELFLKQDRKCALTGLAIELYNPNMSKPHKEKTASLDRIDSSKGYIYGNIQWVHKDLNRFKNRYSEVELYNYCKLIFNHLKNKYEHIDENCIIR